MYVGEGWGWDGVHIAMRRNMKRVRLKCDVLVKVMKFRTIIYNYLISIPFLENFL